MARVLLLALLVVVWVATEEAASLLHSDSSNESARFDDLVDRETTKVEERLNEALDCPEPFRQVGSGCYYFEDEQVMTWDDARAYCQDLNSSADLAVLNDCYEFEVVWNYILVNDDSSSRWIGANDISLEGSWHWVTGTPVPMGTPFWHPGRPDGDGDCLVLTGVWGYFNDHDCSVSFNFVCQILY